MPSFKDIENTEVQTNYDPQVSMSERFAQAQKSVDWNGHPYFSLDDADKTSRNPVNRVYNENDIKNITSDAGTIAWDSFRKGVLDLSSVGDKAQLALGNTLSGISGNTVGTEMRDKAADRLMKTMEDSRFIDSNYGDAETWTARFVGGGMSMGEMLAVGAATGGVGLGAYVGGLSLSDGALNDMAKYQEEHGSLDGYETDPKNLALDYGNATFQVASELMLGTGRLVNGKFLKAGKTSSAVAKEVLDNFIQESAQGAASDLTEVLKGNKDIDVLKENAVGYMKDGIVAGVLGGAIGGTAYKLNKNRALQNLDKINKTLNPEKSEKEIREMSESEFKNTEQKMLDSFIPEITAHNEAINDKGAIRDNVRNKVALMYEDADMSEQEKATTIEATTTLELENMLYDSIERKIPLTANPLLQGEVNELGWFRNGIPEHRRAEVEAVRNELVGLKNELKAQNESEQKDYNKIDELETKIQQLRADIPVRLQDLVIADREQVRNMLSEQRKSVAQSQAKKRMLLDIQAKARKSIKEQDKLAEQMSEGAEKAKAKREVQETKQQTKEAKIRSLSEQRDIARAIKDIKVNSSKAIENRKFNRAVEQATPDSLQRVLLNHGWAGQEYTVKRLTNRQLRAEVKRLKDVQISELVPMSMLEVSKEQAIKETEPKRVKTIKGYFHRKINLQFAKDSGILYAWGYNNTDPAVNLVFVKDGGLKDWKDIADELSSDGYFMGEDDTYEGEDQREEKAKDLLLNKPNMDLNDTGDRAGEQLDYTAEVGYDILKENGFTDEQLSNMTMSEINEELSKLHPDTYEPELTEEQLAQIPDDLYFQDLAEENASLDEIYPEYTGETINIDGKERTVYNSNGDRIAKSEQALRNFYNWFGDSKVVDDKGRPLVVYHGTYAEFNEFLATKIGKIGTTEGTGFYFINNKNEAKVYGNVSSLYLKIENPVYSKSKIFVENSKIANIIKNLKKLGYEFYDEIYSSFNSLIKHTTSYDELLNSIDDIIKGNIKTEEYDENKLYSDIRNSVIKEFKFDGFITNNFGNVSDLTVYVALNSNQIKSTENRGTFSLDTGNIYKQTQRQPKVSGGKDYRGAYLPEYRFIAKTENLDASTLNHELAHDWGQEYFRWARSGKASDSFMRAWGAVERAIGVKPSDSYFTYDASEKFARAYEGWLLQRKDWASILKIDNDDDKKEIEKMMEDYRQQLVDIYDSLLESSKYFKETFGKVGELKPELAEFFERASRYDDVELREKRGEITTEQANNERLNQLVETAVNGQAIKAEQEADSIEQIRDLEQVANETERFETEGGNVKSLQRRLDRIALAQDLVQNSKDLGKYDSHRDMLAVADEADKFVRENYEDSIRIINGEMAEVQGLYASDIYTALERLANETGDIDLIEELRHSKVAEEMAKELGQRVAGFRNYKGSGDIDVMSVLNSLDKTFKKSYDKDKGSEYINSFVAELKAVDNNVQLDEFFDEMECR